MNHNLPTIKCSRIELNYLIKMYSVVRKMLNLHFVGLVRSSIFFECDTAAVETNCSPKGFQSEKRNKFEISIIISLEGYHSLDVYSFSI